MLSPSIKMTINCFKTFLKKNFQLKFKCTIGKFSCTTYLQLHKNLEYKPITIMSNYLPIFKIEILFV